MRHRLEDLGRLYVLIDNLLDKEIFDQISVRPKDFVEHFYERDKDSQEEILRTLAYGLFDVKSELCDCRCIARGEDELNVPA